MHKGCSGSKWRLDDTRWCSSLCANAKFFNCERLQFPLGKANGLVQSSLNDLYQKAILVSLIFLSFSLLNLGVLWVQSSFCLDLVLKTFQEKTKIDDDQKFPALSAILLIWIQQNQTDASKKEVINKIADVLLSDCIVDTEKKLNVLQVLWSLMEQ